MVDGKLGNYLISLKKKLDSVTILFAKQIMSCVLTFRINSKLGKHVLLSAGNIRGLGHHLYLEGPKWYYRREDEHNKGLKKVARTNWSLCGIDRKYICMGTGILTNNFLLNCCFSFVLLLKAWCLIGLLQFEMFYFSGFCFIVILLFLFYIPKEFQSNLSIGSIC